jgi:glycosyltransferase involved in cell wall biosynthesis
MRVGFDARWYNDSGVGTYVAELLKALIPLQSHGIADHADFELVIYENSGMPVPGLAEASVERVTLQAAKYSLAGQVELKRRSWSDRLDVFHSPFYPIPLAMSCAVVVTLHDLIPFLFKSENWFKLSAIKMGYRVAAARANRIIAVSKHTAGDITRILRTSEQKITTIHNGVSHSEFYADESSAEALDLARQGIRSPYVVVGSARNWQTKNLVSALRALALARQQSALEFQTVVYGPPQGLQAAGNLSAWKQLNLVQTGLLPAKELARVFRHASLFMMPSLYEGFGLPVVEAMASGCAVITSNAGSLVEVAGEGAQVFDPYDVISMASAATRLLCDPIEMKTWKRRALRRAADFSWESTARETLTVYHRAKESVF